MRLNGELGCRRRSLVAIVLLLLCILPTIQNIQAYPLVCNEVGRIWVLEEPALNLASARYP